MYVYTHTHTHTHTQGSLSEIHFLTYCNLIGRPMCHHPAIFSRHFLCISQTFPQGKFGVRLINVTISVYGTLKKYEGLKLPSLAV
jgi:hypothetical protein